MSYESLILAEPGLQYYWELGEPSGLTAADSKGSDTGTYHSGNTLGQTGIPGSSLTAVSFDGSSNSYVSTALTSLSVTSPLSIECWVKIASNPGSAAFLFGMVNAPTGASAWSPNLSIDSSGRPNLVAYDGTVRTVVGPVLSTGVWHHIVGTIAGGNMILYVDGFGAAVGTVGSLIITSNQLVIGGSSSGLGLLVATIGQAAFYNAAIGSLSVINHYRAGAIVGAPTPRFTSRAKTSIIARSRPPLRFQAAYPTSGDWRDAVGGAWPTYANNTSSGSAHPLATTTPWGPGLACDATTQNIIYPAGSGYKGAVPKCTLFAVAKLSGSTSVASTFFSYLVGSCSSNSGVSLGMRGAFPTLSKMGVGNAPMTVLWPFDQWVAVAGSFLPGASTVTMFLYAYDSESLTVQAVSDSSTPGILGDGRGTVNLSVSDGGSAGYAIGTIVTAGIDGNVWSVADFMRFVADPLWKVRPLCDASVKFASAAPGFFKRTGPGGGRVNSGTRAGNGSCRVG